MISLTGQDKERLLAILNSWHKIEFFIPFDLEGSVVKDTHSYKQVHWILRGALHDESGMFPFPDCTAGKAPRYDLFLGVFDKNELSLISDKILEPTQTDEFENEARGSLGGATCFAKIKLNEQKEPLFDEISISTLPWALGTVQRSGLQGLSAREFSSAQGRLVKMLQNFATQRGQADTPLPLTAEDVTGLRNLLYEWAQFKPNDEKALGIIQWQGSYQRSGSKDEDDRQDADSPVEPDIDILNSFFIQDIERAIQDVEAGRISRSLYEFLTARSQTERIDVYSNEGRQLLKQKLHPKLFNHGHWFDTPEHLMSLMQQFAINMAFEVNAESGIFSVNGPPGTGKTTLLRDVVAENIVRRANVLASYQTAGCAFDGKKQIPLGEGIWVRTLKPELTGFEMIVASSNNAAVNNISRELPKQASLGDCWRQWTYIQPTAQKIATRNKGNQFTPLPENESQWGLIACALGNANNRRKFNNGFAFYPNPKNPLPAHELGLLTIYDWIKQYDGPTFDAAKASFLNKQKQVEEELEKRAEFADLTEELAEQTETTYTGAELHKVELCRQEATDIKKRIADTSQKASTIRHAILRAEKDRHTLDQRKPSWFSRLLRRPSAMEYISKTRVLKSMRKSLEADIVAVESRLELLHDQETEINAQWKEASNRLNMRRHEWNDKTAKLSGFKQQFPDIDVPGTPDELESDTFQLRGLWNDKGLSTLRTELFGAALSLHEAWLAEVGRNKATGGAGFGGNIMAISSYLKGHDRLQGQDALTIWQSLFMIVPVVSTTFASYANQFKDVGSSSLGWLFIDEAGQAVPQAAVGALWRAQNTVVVGDPLQIEPVFTVPANLIRSISALSPYTKEDGFAPDTISAQNLADACNKYGAYTASGSGETKTWIGSPLRVHRRCIDPMFSVSNDIAYEGKMIFGLPHKSTPDQPPLPVESSWVHIPGTACKQQIVPGQIEFVIRLIIGTFIQYGELPAIYVISPFKAVKNELQKKLTKDWASYGATAMPPNRTLHDWCKERIGTVHTFQGKEEDCVIMVLGADGDTKIGAAQWASSKPNLLNVAITRAKKRCFIVGDKKLWARMKYFPIAQREFKTTTPEIMLGALLGEKSP